MRLIRVVVPVLLVPLLACASPSRSQAEVESPPASASDRVAAAAKVPSLRVRTVVTGLDHPWDVATLPGGDLLYTQRNRATVSLWSDGTSRTLAFPSQKVWVSGETGLMGLVADPEFASNRRVYTCQGGYVGDGHDVGVYAWRMDQERTKLTLIRKLVGGFPTSSGRHGGCRLLIDRRNGSLLVGTGDAAVGVNPEKLTSLGGKTLRLDRFSGKPWPKNPFAGASNRAKRYVFSYGHRNVQGLAQRADGRLWSIEQGTSRDDEVNLLHRGGDYGYNPVPGYNESVPMTDHSLPGPQRSARWRSGDPTLATCGGTFVNGAQWGALDGTLAVAALKAERLVFLRFNDRGHLTKVRAPAALRQFGRLRTAVQAPNGSLLVTTDNGEGNDVILRVRPA